MHVLAYLCMLLFAQFLILVMPVMQDSYSYGYGLSGQAPQSWAKDMEQFGFDRFWYL